MSKEGKLNLFGSIKIQRNAGPGAVAHACHHSTFGSEAGGSLEARNLRPAWPTLWNPISTKNTKKISRPLWHAPVVPATREAEEEESLEPRRWKLQWAEIVPLHCSLVTEQDSVSKKKKKSLFAQCHSGDVDMEAGKLLECTCSNITPCMELLQTQYTPWHSFPEHPQHSTHSSVSSPTVLYCNALSATLSLATYYSLLESKDLVLHSPFPSNAQQSARQCVSGTYVWIKHYIRSF